MRSLVTGGTGFLGSALVKRLLEEGHEVVSLDNNSRNFRKMVPSEKLIVLDGDIRDAEVVEYATKGCDVVWHLAYINGTKHFYEKPHEVLDVAIRGAFNTIESARRNGVKRYVLASSSEVYHQPDKVPTAEDVGVSIPDVKNPRFSYGGGKILSELLVLHAAARDMDVVIFRPHNVYGPAMGWEHVIPEFIVRLNNQRGKDQIQLKIQGSGEQTRAFCYIADAVEGILLAGLQGAHQEVYHVGTPVETSIRNLAMKIAKMMNLEIGIVSTPLPEGGPLRRCPDISKLRRLGYEPKVSLEEGLALTIDWYLAQVA